MKRYRITVTQEEHQQLKKLFVAGKGAAQKRLHARILLKADQASGRPGWEDKKIADALECGTATIQRLRKRFVEEGLESALARRPTRTYLRKINGQGEALLVATCCSDPPKGRSRWTLKLLADKLVALLDQLNPHTSGSVYVAFPPQETRALAERLEIHCTPKHGSWLNMAEIEPNVLTRQCLSDRIATKPEMKKQVAAWQAQRNRRTVRIDLRFTTEDARIKL